MPSTTVSRPRTNQPLLPPLDNHFNPSQAYQTQLPPRDVMEWNPAIIAERQREKDYLARERATRHAESDRDFALRKADLDRAATYREVDEHLANKTLLRRGRYYLPHERHNPSQERSVAKRETENLYRRAEAYLESRALANRSEHQNLSAPSSYSTPWDVRSPQPHLSDPKLVQQHEVWEEYAHLLSPTPTIQDRSQRPQNLLPQSNTQQHNNAPPQSNTQQCSTPTHPHQCTFTTISGCQLPATVVGRPSTKHHHYNPPCNGVLLW